MVVILFVTIARFAGLTSSRQRMRSKQQSVRCMVSCWLLLYGQGGNFHALMVSWAPAKRRLILGGLLGLQSRLSGKWAPCSLQTGCALHHSGSMMLYFPAGTQQYCLRCVLGIVNSMLVQCKT